MIEEKTSLNEQRHLNYCIEVYDAWSGKVALFQTDLESDIPMFRELAQTHCKFKDLVNPKRAPHYILYDERERIR